MFYYVLGSGVFALHNISKGKLLTTYDGELLSQKEGDKRHASYRVSDGSFLFFFKDGKKSYW